MKTNLTGSSAWALLLLLSLGLLSAFGPSEKAESPVTVILVRHAETAGSTRSGGDAKLSEAGIERAEVLAALLEKSGVTHLYSSQFERTKAVLAPLAEVTGLEVRSLDAEAQAEQIALIKALPPGSVAVIAGHSNTVPAMVIALGGQPENMQRHPQYGPMLEHAEYGRLFQLTLPVDSKSTMVKLLEMHYGE